MNARRLLCGFVIALSCCLSLAQDAATQPASRPAMTREEGIKYLHGHRDEVKKYMSANQEIGKLFAAKEYEKAAEACVAFTKDYPWDAGGFYNLACAQARMGKADEAVASLKSALAVGYDDTAHLKTDADLASLHKHDSWKDLVEQSRKNEVTGPWEKGAEFKGVKTVEDFPEGGLRYRLRMSPDATKDKPNKLVI